MSSLPYLFVWFILTIINIISAMLSGTAFSWIAFAFTLIGTVIFAIKTVKEANEQQTAIENLVVILCNIVENHPSNGEENQEQDVVKHDEGQSQNEDDKNVQA